jgi:energy-coupling factor transporter ATP-binding protein EcfA2
MPLRDRPLLVGGVDRDLYVPRPELEHSLLQSVEAGRNVLLIGPPGSGKSTTLRKLAVDLRARGRRGVLVLASPASTSEELLAMIGRETYSLGVEAPGDVLRTELPGSRGHEVPLVNLIETVRKLGLDEEAVIMLDGPLSAEIVYELFGRLREELWALPHQWVLALRTEQSAPARKAPADAFFPQLVEIPSLQPSEIRDLLGRALSNEELLAVWAELEHHDIYPFHGPSEVVYPREVVNLGHRALAGTLHSLDSDLRRTALASDLGPSALMALAEIEALGKPVSAGDQEFLLRVGWTEAHARRLLAQMENSGVLSSISDTTAVGPGRPRKLYVPKHNV